MSSVRCLTYVPGNRCCLDAIYKGVKRFKPAETRKYGEALFLRLAETGQIKPGEPFVVLAACTEVPEIIKELKANGSDEIKALLANVEVKDPMNITLAQIARTDEMPATGQLDTPNCRRHIMAVAKFRELREGIITLLSQKSGKAFEGAPTEDNPLLKDLDTLAIAIDGVPLMLTYYEPVKSDRAFVFVNYGVIPPELELAALRRLLEVNFMLYQGNAPAFTREPESGHVMLLSEIPLDSATPVTVLSYLRALSYQALEWRKGFFIPDSVATSADNFAKFA